MSPRPRRLLLAGVAAIAIATVAGCGGDASTAGATPATPAGGRTSSPPDPSRAATDAVFGPWRRSPVTPTPAFVRAAEDACRADAAVEDASLAVLDARGEGRALLVFTADGGATLCIADVAADGTATVGTRPIPASGQASPPPAGTLGIHDMHIVDAGASTYSVLVGTVGGNVHDIGVNFDADAAWYSAAMDNGWYAIWWPGEPKPLGVAASDPRSVVIDSYAP